jgi:multiple antibiotic resistance protein
MIETALSSFTTFLATIGPLEAAVFFAALTPHVPSYERRRIAMRATMIATIILAFFTLLGGPILRELGVSIPALQVAGGVILMLIAIDMIFARPGVGLKLSVTEGEEAQTRDDLAVFPLATPLLAGPGAMSAGILLAAGTHGDPIALATVSAALAGVMLVTLVLLLLAHELSRVLSLTAQRVLMRVFGILLAAIAVQALFNGLRASGLVPLA